MKLSERVEKAAEKALVVGKLARDVFLRGFKAGIKDERYRIRKEKKAKP